MEFFQEVHHPGLAIPRLKQSLTIENLPNLCASISTASPRSENEGELYCLWGSFNVRRDEIRNGVRYALVECPHALAWTVTLDEARAHVVIHCTIDKTQPDPEFAESIHGFVADWADGVRDGIPVSAPLVEPTSSSASSSTAGATTTPARTSRISM